MQIQTGKAYTLNKFEPIPIYKSEMPRRTNRRFHKAAIEICACSIDYSCKQGVVCQ